MRSVTRLKKSPIQDKLLSLLDSISQDEKAWVLAQFPCDHPETEPGSTSKGRKTVDLTAYLCLQQVRKP